MLAKLKTYVEYHDGSRGGSDVSNLIFRRIGCMTIAC